MSRSWIGLGILAIVVLVSVAYVSLGGVDALRRVAPESREPVTVALYFGGEKARFLANPEIERLLESRYAVTLDAIKAGSIEMVVDLDPSRVDCLWPSNAVAVELARNAGRAVLSDTNVFSSPIVFYAWAEVAEALAAKGVVRERADGFLVADVAALAAMIEDGARWREDLGLEVFGPVKVFSTDPTKSNSGNIWSALLATALNDGATPVAADMSALTPKLAAYFAAMGHMEDSSGDIFENFLKQGVGSRPIIVGYENQMIEFLVENAQYAELISQKLRVIYPEPTIFASHPLISLTPACGRLAEALGDPDAQAIAWRDHGFRTGVLGVENDPSDIAAARLPERIGLVAPMPSAAVMEEILGALR